MRPIPEWVVGEVADWVENRRTGALTIEFRSGEPTGVRRGDEVKAPLQEPVTGICPDCGRKMEELDYGNRWRCACGKTWSRWELLERRKLLKQQ